MTKKTSCPDCGPAPVIHQIERFSAMLDWVLEPLSTPFEAIWRKIAPAFATSNAIQTIHKLFIQLAKAGAGKILSEPDDKDNLRTLCIWEEAKKRGIKVTEFRLFGLSRDTLIAEYDGRTIIFDGLPRPELAASKGLNWMDNKGIMRKKFEATSLPIAKGKVCFTERSALKVFRSIGAPMIMKPHLGSRSRHTTVHIMNETEAKIAFRKAKRLSPWVIVEQELEGQVYRATIIGGKVVGIARRDPAQIQGDGMNTIKKLVEEENKNPIRHGHIFHTLPTDQSAEEELKLQNMTWESIPKKGEWVILNRKTSRSVGGGSTDVTDIAHPENIKLFEDIAKVLNDSLTGVDFIIKDISRSWKEQPRTGVIECNSLPFLDLHQYPLFGTPRNAAGALWDLVFPTSGK